MKDKAFLIGRLTEARDTLARQADALASVRSDYSIGRETHVGELIKQLRSILSELEECLAVLDEASE
jgi:hypothetical protein